MVSHGKRVRNFLRVVALVALLAPSAAAWPQRAEGLSGQILDPAGAVIVGAGVTLTDAAGAERKDTTNAQGVYLFADLAPGRYAVRAEAPGFAPSERQDVEVAAGRRATLNLTLEVKLEGGEVTVGGASGLSTAPENNAGAIVLSGSDLESLPDDPDDLTTVLQALAGPGVGPGGGQIIVDGFTNNAVPPKASIREVRLNQNPFSAEYDQLGFGRIEIFTRPGTDKFRGQVFFNFNDEALNSRNPFASRRAPYQSRFYGGNVSGPIKQGRTSYFVDFQRRETDDNSVISATILDPALNITPFSQVVLTPKRLLTFTPRLDHQINAENTLTARYAYFKTTSENSGIGNFNLASRAYDLAQSSHTLQLTETAILNLATVNELRFQYIRRQTAFDGDTATPGLRVLEAFSGGSSQVGESFNTEDRWELTNITTRTAGAHTLRFGGRVRGVSLTDFSQFNFGGTFTFAGGTGPQLDAAGAVVTDPSTGQPVIVPVTSIERYRRTLFFGGLGLTPAEIRQLGGGATQLTVAGGDGEADVRQTDLGLFFLDDWRLRPNFTLSLGLRYETQTNIGSRLGLAPRVAFAWSPGAAAGGRAKTVVRGGFGVFYERFGETLTLQANRFNAQTQQLFIVTDPAVLDLFPNVPPVADLAGFAAAPITRRVAEDLREPYTLQGAFSVERQLPRDITLSATFINSRTLHLLRSRNINAPIPGTFTPGDPASGRRPFGNVGDIYLYESSGIQNHRQLVLNASTSFGSRFSAYAAYLLSSTNNDTDGPNSFPANPYDLRSEYGRSAFDFRHRFFGGGSISAPWGVTLNPLVIFSSSRPFNITTGLDTNGDTAFNERPALAAPGASGADIVATPFGTFDLTPEAGQALVPRNSGDGPNFFWVILRVGKTFSFVDVGGNQAAARGGGGGGGRPPEKRFRLAVSVQIQNLFNRTNEAAPIGNLSSPLFGRSNSIGGGSVSDSGGTASSSNRRIELQMRFIF